MPCPQNVAVDQHHWYTYLVDNVDYYSDAVVTAVIGDGQNKVNMTVLPVGLPSFDVTNVPYGCFAVGYWTCHVPGPGCTPGGCIGGLR